MFGLTFGPKSISVEEAHKKIGTDGHVLLDVRTEEEFKEICAPGARNIPLDRLSAHVDDLSKHDSIHVICRSGGRSAMATNTLHDAGIPHAVNVSGGMNAWEKVGLPTK